MSETRLEAYLNLERRENAATLRIRILTSLLIHGPASPWEMALRLGFIHRQDVAPRFTELASRGYIQETNIYCVHAGTKMRSMVWKITENGRNFWKENYERKKTVN